MRVSHLIPLLSLVSLLALAACSRASAATVDPNNDYDCSVAFDFFREVAKLQGGPDKARQGLFVLSQWYSAKYDHDHPGEADKQSDHYAAMVKAMAKDASMTKGAVRSCTERASADPNFNKFATLLSQRFPDAR